eukprot:g13810.t1
MNKLRPEDLMVQPVAYPNAASHPYNEQNKLLDVDDEEEEGQQPQATDSVTADYLVSREKSSVSAGAGIDEAHEKFVKHCVSEQRAAADTTFRSWMGMFRDSPQLAQTVVQSYAAVVVARENRVGKMHDQFCKLMAKRLDIEAFCRSVKEKCRADVVKKYLSEKWQSNRTFVQEKWESQRVAVRVWGDVCKKQQDEVTKRLQAAEITKRLQHVNYREKKLAAAVALFASFVLATANRPRERRRLLLVAFLGYVVYHFRAFLREKIAEACRKNALKTVMWSAGGIFGGGEEEVTKQDENVEADCDGAEETTEFDANA